MAESMMFLMVIVCHLLLIPSTLELGDKIILY